MSAVISYISSSDLLVDVIVTVSVSCGSVVLDVKVVVLVMNVVVGAGVIVETGLTVTLDVWVKKREIVLVDEGTGLVDLVPSFFRQSCCVKTEEVAATARNVSKAAHAVKAKCMMKYVQIRDLISCH